MSCEPGWFVSFATENGKCFKCESPCVTCIEQPQQCLTCESGFTRKGWMCLNDNHLTFNFTLLVDEATVLNEIDNVT